MVALTLHSVQAFAQRGFGRRSDQHAHALAAEVFVALHRLVDAREHARAVEERRQREIDHFAARERHRARIAQDVHAAVAHRLEALVGGHQHVGHLDIADGLIDGLVDRRGDLTAQIDDVAGRLALFGAVGMRLGVGAIADPEHARLAHAVECRRQQRLRRQDKQGQRWRTMRRIDELLSRFRRAV